MTSGSIKALRLLTAGGCAKETTQKQASGAAVTFRSSRARAGEAAHRAEQTSACVTGLWSASGLQRCADMTGPQRLSQGPGPGCPGSCWTGPALRACCCLPPTQTQDWPSPGGTPGRERHLEAPSGINVGPSWCSHVHISWDGVPGLCFKLWVT